MVEPGTTVLEWDDDGTLVEDALRSLADAARPEIVPALRDAFGGVSGLFVALWRTASGDDSAGNDRPEKLAAFAWIEEGCEPFR